MTCLYGDDYRDKIPKQKRKWNKRGDWPDKGVLSIWKVAWVSIEYVPSVFHLTSTTTKMVFRKGKFKGFVSETPTKTRLRTFMCWWWCITEIVASTYANYFQCDFSVQKRASHEKQWYITSQTRHEHIKTIQWVF